MPTYVIESSWSWDKSHTEYATLSIEEYDFSSNPIKDLEDPVCPEEHRQSVFKLLRDIAELQNGCPAGPRFVAIHRVVSVEEQKKENGEKKVVFHLKPVFRFIENGRNPVPIS